MSETVILKNMFGNGNNNSKQIIIPSENKDLINNIITYYNYIYDLFNPKNIDTKSIDTLNEIVNTLDAEFTSQLSILGNVGKTINDAFSNSDTSKKNEIQTQLKKGSTYNMEFVYATLYLILFYSFFKYDEESIPFYSIEDTFYNDDIFEWHSQSFDGESKNFYRFKNDNRFFKMMNMCCSQSWATQGVTHDPPGLGNEQKEIDLGSLLTNGYYKNSRNNKYYTIFDDKYSIIKFIYDCILPSMASSTIYVGNFSINIGRSMTLGLSDTVIELFKSNIANYEREHSSKGDTENSICNGNVVFAVKSANEYVTNFTKVFEYGFSIVKKYIEVLRDDSDIKQSDILYNTYLRKIIDKLIGATTSGNLKFSKKFKTNVFDFDNNGQGILQYLKTKYKASSCDISKIKIEDIKNIQLDSRKAEKTNIFPTNLSCSDDSADSLFSSIEYSINNAVKANDYSEFVPLLFYETAVYKDFKNPVSSTKSGLENEITQFCRISGNVLSKLSLFCIFDLQSTSKALHSSTKNLSFPGYKFVKKYSNDNDVVNINGVTYSKIEDIYDKLGNLVLSEILNLINAASKEKSNSESAKETLKNQTAYDDYIKSRFATGYFTEKDYFYINDSPTRKKIPVNPFVEIEFNVPYATVDKESGKGTISTKWLPVTSVKVTDDREKNDIIIYSNYTKGSKGDELLNPPLHAGTYFESFELTDNAGVKEISLTLKSSNDMNLERIIYNSLSLEEKVKLLVGSGNQISNLDEMLKNSESNFRMRFGYRDLSAKDANSQKTTITADDVSDEEFINRTNNPQPVQIYPWTYFKITGLESEIKNGEDRYTIKAITSGSYILSSMTLCGITSNFSNSSTNDNFLGKPKNVIGKLAKWIMMGSADDGEGTGEKNLSTARICFLGDGEDNNIITDFDNSTEQFRSDYKYKLKGGSSLKGGNIESIENFFYDSTNSNKLLAKNFNIINDTKTLSIKEILDSLVSWLPNRVYYIGKLSSGDTLAVYLPYEAIYDIPDFFNSCPFKTEGMKYQVIEADACIYESDSKPPTDTDYHKTYFIRMYYEGPSRTLSQKESEEKNKENSEGQTYDRGNNYIRIYNYRSLQEQVIENIELSSNDAEFANTTSSVMMLGGGTPIVFSFNKSSGTLDNEARSGNNGESISINDSESDIVKNIGKYSKYFEQKPDEEIKPYIAFNNSKYLVTSVKGAENFNTIASMYKNEASLFFSSMQNKLYTGEMTILGDPFYYFDSSVEAGKYEIYLQMNRVEDPNTYKITPSRYTGIYYITGIKHNMDETGKFTTTLSITKRIFGSND